VVVLLRHQRRQLAATGLELQGTLIDEGVDVLEGPAAQAHALEIAAQPGIAKAFIEEIPGGQVQRLQDPQLGLQLVDHTKVAVSRSQHHQVPLDLLHLELPLVHR